MELTSIEAQNFLRFGHIKLNLQKRGVVLIEGDNRDSTAADSNGAGKSSIFDAIAWCIFGKTIRISAADEVVHEKVGKNCYVEVEFLQASHTYKIRRHRKDKKHGNDVHFFCDGNDIREGTNPATDRKIIEVVKLDYKTFVNTVIFGGSESSRFTTLADAEQKAIFEEMLGLSEYERAQQTAKEMLKEVKFESSLISSKIADTNRRKEMIFQQIEDTKTKAKGWDDGIKSRIQSKVDELEELRKKTFDTVEIETKIKNLDSQIEDEDKLKKELEDASDLKSQVDAQVSAVNEKIAKLRGDIVDAEKTVNKLEKSQEPFTPPPCRTCGRTYETVVPGEMTKEMLELISHTKKSIEEWSKELEEAKSTEDVLQEAFDLAKKEWATINKRVDVRNNLLKKKNALVVEKVQIQSKQKEQDSKIESQEKAIEELKTLKNPYSELDSNLLQQLEQFNKDLVEQNAELTSIIEQEAYLKFWDEAFGLKGIRSILMDDILPVLNKAADEASKTISDGELDIEFKNRRQLGNGSFKEEFNIVVNNLHGSAVYKLNSSGEKRKVDVCSLFAVNSALQAQPKNRVNLLGMDEVFDALDETSCERVVKLIHNQLKYNSTILIVTHNPSLRQHFDKVIRVVKEGGFSRIED